MNALVILAGGLSSRMGQDKVFLDFGGKTFLETTLDKAYGLFDRIVIAGGSRMHAEQIYEYLKSKNLMCTSRQPEILVDAYESIGPMGGIMTVFEQTDIQEFACISVDMPLAEMKVLALLLKELKESEKGAFMLADLEGRLEPCVAAYSRRTYASLKEAEAVGDHSLTRTLKDEIQPVYLHHIMKRIPGLNEHAVSDLFRNVNTAEEYSAL